MLLFELRIGGGRDDCEKSRRRLRACIYNDMCCDVMMRHVKLTRLQSR